MAGEVSWVDSFIDKVEAAVSGGGKLPVVDKDNNITAYITIGIDFLRFLMANRVRLQMISIETFKHFLYLLSKKQDFDALITIYKELDTQSLVDKYKEDSIKLAEIAKESQENRDFWISFAKQAAERLVFSALGALL